MKTAQRCFALAMPLIAILSPTPLWACRLGRLAILHVTMAGAPPLVMALDSGAFFLQADLAAARYGIAP